MLTTTKTALSKSPHTVWMRFIPLQEGRAKGTMFKLHFTEYDNHSNIPSWGGGYGNIFQDERDVKFIVIAPFTIF
ncbi:outer membrane protein [Salmonella enterica subsp. enterica]|nr:outer membrane protein [Salmonella enterica subsp. enterica]